jgi:cytochrome c oxidase subunit 3
MRKLDVAHLPTYGFGTRTPIWWGNTLMLLIETSMFVMCLVTYFYLRQTDSPWPPRPIDRPDLLPAAANLAVLLVSSVAMYAVGRAVERRSVPGMRAGLLACLILGLAALALRAGEMDVLHFKWSTHAYGSIFWTTLGLHTGHLLTATLEDAAMLYQLVRGPIYVKHLHDVRLTGVYWHWMVFILIPIDVVLYLVPRMG